MIGSPLRIGTRGSRLALTQARMVSDLLAATHPLAPAAEIVTISTTGDRVQDRTLAEIGGKGLFTKEIDEALLAGRVDVAVHSMKDVETELPDGLMIACFLERADPRDALIMAGPGGLEALAPGAVVGTASLRRGAQVLARRPDVTVKPLRGNVETRLRKIRDGDADATLLAVAGLTRLGLADHATAILEPEDMLPAVAQGAIGLTCQTTRAEIVDWIAPLNHGLTWDAVTAERALLRELDGTCRTPIAALAEINDGQLRLRGLVARPDGGAVHRIERRGARADAQAIGQAAGRALRNEAGADIFAGFR